MCQILRLKCTKSISAGAPGSAPNPAGELTALLRPLSWNKGGLLLREGEGCSEGNGRGKRGKEEGGEGKGVEGPPGVSLKFSSFSEF